MRTFEIYFFVMRIEETLKMKNQYIIFGTNKLY